MRRTITRTASLSIALLLLGCSSDDPQPGGSDAAVVDAAGGSDGPISPDAGGDLAPFPDAPPPQPPGGYAVLVADELVEVAAEYASYREGQGLFTEVRKVSQLVSGSVEPDALIAAVQGWLGGLSFDGPGYLLLLGDAPGLGEQTTGQIVAASRSSTEGTFNSDNEYGDLDDDELPEFAVGRVPMRTAAQARAYLQKVKAFEAHYEPGVWNRRISLYTGRAGFSPEIDAAIEMGVMEGLKRANHAFDFIGAYNNPASDFYYQPFEGKVVELFNQGSIFVIYVGHGSSQSTSGLDASQLGQIHCAHRLPASFFFACGNGEYVGPDDSISEAVLHKSDGPIVALGAAGVSHPYGNAVLLYEVMRVLLDLQPATFGEGLRQAKHAVIDNDDEFRRLIDGLSLTEVPPEEQALIRYDHVGMYNLLGDPATRIPWPRGAVVFDAVDDQVAQGTITVAGRAAGIDQGSALVTVEVERDALLHTLEPVDPENPDTATVQANWEKAMDKVVDGQTVTVSGGAFSAELSWTPPLPAGPLYIKVYAENETRDAFGVHLLP
jgi:hypothetical protein